MFGSKQPRSTEGFMDYQWDTNGGPRDPTSPFPQASRHQSISALSQNQSLLKSRTGLQSSIANTATATPFRNPAFTPATPSGFAPSNSPVRKSTFTTPQQRCIESEFDTSGAESSPASLADAEETPDQILAQATIRPMVSTSKHKQSLFGSYGSKFTGGTPTRADRRVGRVGREIAEKFRKRKRPDTDLDSEYGSDSSAIFPPRRAKNERAGVQQSAGWFGTLVSGIESRPHLPNILSIWTQFALNFSMIAGLIYLAYCFWSAVKSDVDQESEKARNAVLTEMAQCAHDYAANRCGHESRAPALATVCQNWLVCMERDPMAVGRARVSAKTFAEILNNFIEPISYKSMIFVLLTILVGFAASNIGLSMFRAKHESAHAQPPNPFFSAPAGHQQQHFIVPSWQQHEHQGPWGPMLPPRTPSQSQGFDSYASTPTGMLPAPSQRSPSKGETGMDREKRGRHRGVSQSPSKGSRY